MIDGLDHVAVAVEDLDRAGAAFQALLGRPPHWREEAAGARHAWFQLANTAIDVVQAEGPGESGDRVRAQIAMHGEGLWGLAFAASNLEEMRRLLARRGAPTREPADLLSTDAWKLSFLEPEASHGVPIALAERVRPAAMPPGPFEAGEAYALDHVVVRTPNPDRAIALYGARLGLDFRLDRSNPEWGSRLLFFRCGDMIVEIAADPKAAPTEALDRLTGLAWRTGDPDVARGRLAKAGFEVSDVRPGRKPGTRVFTVRSGVPGGPALMIAED
ncbi:MAG TPA: VOC family protein [Caulobacteraceae bacterium]|nr:VOC family protein [Caulobacteraceae bacterium]